MSYIDSVFFIVPLKGILYEGLVECLGIEWVTVVLELDKCWEHSCEFVEHKGSTGYTFEIFLILDEQHQLFGLLGAE